MKELPTARSVAGMVGRAAGTTARASGAAAAVALHLPTRRGHKHSEDAPPLPARPREVFVLSGGGSLGAAQVGMLQALLEAGVVPDHLVGCSVGSLNAAYLAADPTLDRAEQLCRRWTSLRSQDVFPRSTSRAVRNVLTGKDHLVSVAGVRHLVHDWLEVSTFEQLATPLSVVTTRLEDGATVVHSQGDLRAPLLASTAIPGAFPPVRLADGSTHVDGGVTSLVPLRPALALDPVRVWVLDITGGSAGRMRDRMAALDVLMLGFSLAMRYQADVLELAHAHPRVQVISPRDPLLARTGLRDFGNTARLVRIGREEAERVVSAACAPTSVPAEQRTGRAGAHFAAPERARRRGKAASALA